MIQKTTKMIMTLMGCLLVNVSFGQIEKVDTLINIVYNTTPYSANSTYIELDLNGDNTNDLIVDVWTNYLRIRYKNIQEGEVANDNWDNLQLVCTYSTIHNYNWKDYGRIVFLSPYGLSNLNGSYNLGEALIPLRFKYFNNQGGFYNYKYVILKLDVLPVYGYFNITGWYINHTYNQPLSCNLAYNDSIIASYNIPVPVELISFKADTINGNVQLEWETASEENNAGFEIERSFDGSNFEKIGFVEGNGTTYEYSNYLFLDEGIKRDIMYYRLKQIDYDGQFEYSNVVVITYSDNNTLSKIYPNPADEVLYLRNLIGVVNIYNLMGQLVLTDTNLGVLRQVDISSLLPGIYYVRSKNDTYKLLVY